MLKLQRLLLELYDCNANALRAENIERFLLEAPERIGMRRVSKPVVCRYGTEEGKETISGFVVIAESHIAVHALPGDRFAYVDMLSCRDFDGRAAERYAKNYFEAGRVESCVFRSEIKG
ncbi:MAG: S-adenosylmethionine decarboxylase [Candidatus Aenigmarchaeota archaeon]|nr:S-adenosylmethionine decarboxylase [Candidatus Aenigmarchaeota archaeon]